MANLGTVRVILYAGLPGEDPQQVGTVNLPLTVKPTSMITFELSLEDPLEVVRETLQRIFAEEPSDAG